MSGSGGGQGHVLDPKSSSPDLTSGGITLGGGAASTPTDPREAARRAALARNEKMLPELERAAKQELIGKLTEMYRRRGEGPPFNLGALPLPRLKELYTSMGGRS